jgi:hypothetical protein
VCGRVGTVEETAAPVRGDTGPCRDTGAAGGTGARGPGRAAGWGMGATEGAVPPARTWVGGVSGSLVVNGVRGGTDMHANIQPTNPARKCP